MEANGIKWHMYPLILQDAEDVLGQCKSGGGRKELDLLSAMMNIKPPPVSGLPVLWQC
jgi:hypothetical protein